MVTIQLMPALPTLPSADHVLLERWCAHADRQALTELLRLHQDACWRVAYHLCGNAADAEDAVQEAVILVMRHARQQRGGSIRAWLLAIVANAARARHRQESARRRREGQPSPRAGTQAADPAHEALHAALARLPERYALPVILTYIEGWSSEAVASHLGLTAVAVRKRCERGLARLRTAPELVAPALTVVDLPRHLGSLGGAAGAAPAVSVPLMAPALGAAISIGWMITIGTLGVLITVTGILHLTPLQGAARTLALAGAQVAMADPPPPPLPLPAALPTDAQRLATPVTLPRRIRTLNGLLYDLQLALPPSLSFEADDFALTYTCTLGFDHLPLHRALDQVTAQVHVGWTMLRGHLTLFILPGAAPLDPADPPYGDVAALRQLVLRWCAQNPAAQHQLEDALNVLDPESVPRPFPALASDAALVAALTAVLPARLQMTAPVEDRSSVSVPALCATVLAGFLHLDQFAPTVHAQLEAMVHWQDGPPNADTTLFNQRFSEAFRREALIEALGWIGRDQDVPLLTQIATDDGPTIGVQEAARGNYGNATALLEHHDGEANHFSYKHREMAIDALSRIGTPTAIRAIVAVVQDRTPYAPRGAAAWQLGRIGAQAGLPAIRSALAAKRHGLSGEVWYQGEDGEAFGLLWALGRLAPDGPHELVQLLSDASLRPSILAALGWLRDDQIARSLLIQLQQLPECFDSTELTLAAAAILAQGNGPSLVEALLRGPLNPQLARTLSNELARLTGGSSPAVTHEF
jgi:RNA polymerase sigma-70 factor (ECF subfamily)